MLHYVYVFFCLMKRLPPRSTRTDPPCPYTTLFRSEQRGIGQEAAQRRWALAIEIVARHPAREQQLRNEIIGGEVFGGHVGTGAPPMPWLADDRTHDAAGCVVHRRAFAAGIRWRTAREVAAGGPEERRQGQEAVMSC